MKITGGIHNRKYRWTVLYGVDSASKDVEVNNNFTTANNMKLLVRKRSPIQWMKMASWSKTVKQNVSKITYTETKLSSDKTYDNVEAAEKDLADKKQH